ncbi:ATP-binding cassette domain-containing protein [Chroococcidiopsis sp. TS-821]|uniref:ATP-binding cassette domain-containing protein n=1 Tax=Chroococcidiopsis sp. TS-821 TaxID=1378066 RepID=UPI000CEF595C|nr:ATP-binding cassette domain-containing protein [Chroococcidiopsis sp. TS-821]PPS45490.1 hypothetical protein B1A85_04380 [Chroococcidiopsis sp. TS-821]
MVLNYQIRRVVALVSSAFLLLTACQGEETAELTKAGGVCPAKLRFADTGIKNLCMLQNVLFGAWGRNRNPWKMFFPFNDRYKAVECLDRVGLNEFAARRARDLSGGQQQRVAIALMLMQDPD